MTKFRASESLERDLLALPVVRDGIAQATREVHRAALARASAHRRTGRYMNELEAKAPDENCVGHVIAGAYYSNWVEYGTCSQRSELAPTPCPHPEPKKTGIAPQFIMLGAVMDVTR